MRDMGWRNPALVREVALPALYLPRAAGQQCLRWEQDPVLPLKQLYCNYMFTLESYLICQSLCSYLQCKESRIPYGNILRIKLLWVPSVFKSLLSTPVVMVPAAEEN